MNSEGGSSCTCTEYWKSKGRNRTIMDSEIDILSGGMSEKTGFTSVCVSDEETESAAR